MPSPSVAFNHGVASGDPYSNSVILWTRITPPQGYNEQIDGSWQASLSAGFEPGTIVDSGTFSTSASRDWTVKVEADGLTADTTYYYRFRAGDGESIVGQTKTLPVDSGAVRLAVFSCANFPAADTFAAYGRAAAVNAVNPYDALVHLGDYIYEYGPGGYGAAEDAATDRGFLPNREIVSLEDYRQRYAQYHTDQNLQGLRASAPLIAIWDDHETANDSWSGGAQNHQSETEGEWIARRDAALKAYYEWLPIREPLLRQGVDKGDASTPLTQGYRSFNFGDVLDLHVLETRLTARDEQLDYPDAAAVQARIGAILANPTELLAYAGKLGLTPPTDPAAIPAFGAALAPAVTQELVLATVQKAWGDASRDLIGDTQLTWLQNQMATSNSAWQVLGQQVLMQSMAVPAELLLNAGDPTLLDKYAAPLQKLSTGTAFAELSPAEKALFSEAGKIPYNLDAWDGYGVERETILQSALAQGKRLISLAGDTHNAWAGVLDTMAPGSKPAGTVAGVEFATNGVTSPGLEKYLPGADAYIRAKYPAVDGLDGLFSGYVNGLKYADLNRRGFLDLTVTPEQAVGNFQFLDGVNAQTAQPQWATETVVARSDLSLSITAEATPQINWQPGWSELDLVFGIATDSAGGQSLLDPAAFATLPRASVQLADVTVLGSEAGERIFAGVGSLVDAAGGDDELFNTDSQGGNLLIGGAGDDVFYLTAAYDTIIGGTLVANTNQTGLRPYLALADSERDTFALLSDGFNSNTSLTILDYELNFDQILIDGISSTVPWPERKQSLAEQGFLINAIPELQATLQTSPLRIIAGQQLEVSAAQLGIDPDGDALAVQPLNAPNWITSNGNTLLIAPPVKLVQADVSTPIRLALNDGSAFVPFELELLVEADSTPAVQTPAPGSTVQSVDSDNDGLREVETAPDGKAIDGNNDGIPDAQQANVSGFRLINDGAGSADFGALEVASGVQLQFTGDPLITANNDGIFSFTGRDGVPVTAALPQGLSNSFAGVISFGVTNLTPGSSTEVTVSLPRAITTIDTTQSAYIRYNYVSGRFEEFVDAAGKPLYNLVDRNRDGVLDGIQLKLVDGDPAWDGDGITNGTVVDPGSLMSGQRDLNGSRKSDGLTGNVLANSLLGKRGHDVLIGNLGNDVLIGGRGNDLLDGGEGADLLIGGSGRDHFIYRSAADSSINQSDTISHLSHKDFIDLRSFDGDVLFKFIGNDTFSGTAGELRTTLNSLQADLDGDGSADFLVNFTKRLRLEADQILI